MFLKSFNEIKKLKFRNENTTLKEVNMFTIIITVLSDEGQWLKIRTIVMK